MNRRDFVKKSAIGAGAAAIPSILKGAEETAAATDEPAANSKLNIAIIGVAGKGINPTIETTEESVLALCDVDDQRVADTRSGDSDYSRLFNDAIIKHEKKGAKWYKDYRILLEELGDKLDAVIISTPDHMHYPIAMSAINMGLHVYLEKPLTHTVEEARLLTAAAKEKGVVTQMGNQGHSNGGTRLVKEWLDAGVIGKVREVHSWTDRPAIFWKQGMGAPDHSKFIPVQPKTLRWDLWQGVAEPRAYDPAYVPFAWRAYIDYGCGALGDMACHIMDSAFWGLGLGSPTSIEAVTTTSNGYTFPVSSIVSYEFPSIDGRPPVTFKWYDGDLRPPVPKILKGVNPFEGDYHGNGTLIVGEHAVILTDTYSRVARILPEPVFRELRPTLPPRTIPRIRGTHLEDFLNAIRNGGQATSDFSYSGPFTETVLLGTIAQRLGRKLDFDGKAGKFMDDPEANAMLSKSYPDGWILG
jgi:predicted dehydrogenase